MSPNVGVLLVIGFPAALLGFFTPTEKQPQVKGSSSGLTSGDAGSEAGGDAGSEAGGGRLSSPSLALPASSTDGAPGTSREALSEALRGRTSSASSPLHKLKFVANEVNLSRSLANVVYGRV